MKYQRKIIAVERRLGFLYVPAVGQEFMPKKTGKFTVQLEGETKAKSLSYNTDHRRVFGLTKWYQNQGVEVGTLLNIEILNGLMNVSLDSTNKKEQGQEAETEKLIDLSGLSSMSKGNIVEDRIKELIVLYGQGLLNVYRPVVDNKGIDLIVMREGVFMPIFLQVKSRFNVEKLGSLLIEVGDKTFTAHHSFYILGASFNPTKLELDDKILLIPSRDFEENALVMKGYSKKRVVVSLKDNSKSRWTEYLLSKAELVNALMEKFEEMSQYLK